MKKYCLPLLAAIIFTFGLIPLLPVAAAGNCPPPPATDQASCQNKCECDGMTTGKWTASAGGPGTCDCSNSSSTTTVTIGPPYNATGPQNINQLIGNITTWVLALAGAVAILFIILAGLRYITSHGDSKQTEAAKKALLNAIIGLVVVVLAYTIVMLVIRVLTNT